MENQLYIPYARVRHLIDEADVLLFRSRGLISRLIGRASETNYSHVGIASWVNGDKHNSALEIVEFREGYGGRAVNLSRIIEQYSGFIDVYRPIPLWLGWSFDKDTFQTTLHQRTFDGKAVTRTMRDLTALPYGWKRIWWIAKHKMVVLRLFYNPSDLMVDTIKDIVYPVCSTVASYAFNKNGYDLISNRADEWTEPGQIGMSTRLSYLFTPIL